MSIRDNVKSALARGGTALLEAVARGPFALWLGARRRRSRITSDCVVIHIDEWGRITRLPR